MIDISFMGCVLLLFFVIALIVASRVSGENPIYAALALLLLFEVPFIIFLIAIGVLG